MKIIIGILLICVGLALCFLTYFYVVKRKKFTMTGGGFNLVAFASILLLTGIALVLGV